MLLAEEDTDRNFRQVRLEKKQAAISSDNEGDNK